MTVSFSSQKYYSNEQYIYFWAAKNFRFSCVHAHRHIIFADTSGLFNGDRLISVLNFTSPSKIQISGKRTDFKTEIQNIFRTKKVKKYIKFTSSRVSTTLSVHVLRSCSKKCHSTNKIIPRDWHMRHITNKNNPWQSKRKAALQTKLQKL